MDEDRSKARGGDEGNGDRESTPCYRRRLDASLRKREERRSHCVRSGEQEQEESQPVTIVDCAVKGCPGMREARLARSSPDGDRGYGNEHEQAGQQLQTPRIDRYGGQSPGGKGDPSPLPNVK